jgi:hypothetical protein
LAEIYAWETCLPRRDQSGKADFTEESSKNG